MDFKKALKFTTATVMAASAVVAVAPANADAATKVESSIDKAEKQIQKAYKSFIEAKGIASAKSVKKELTLAQKYYDEAKKEISVSGGSKKDYYTAKLEKSKKYIQRTENYIKGLEYAQALATKGKVLEQSVLKGKKSEVTKDFPAFEKELMSAEKKIKAFVYGKSVEDKLLKTYNLPSQNLGHAVKVYVNYVKAESLLSTPEKAKEQMDEVAKHVGKLDKKTPLGKYVSEYVKQIKNKYDLKQGPVFKYSGKTDIKVITGGNFTVPKVTAKDNIDKKVDVKVTISGPNGATKIDTKQPGEYTITYTATDSHKNTSELVIKVTVRDYKVTFMHTNDTHANVDKMPKRVTAVKEVRAAKPNSLLVDAGDVFSGTLYFNEFKGQADLSFMNLMGYDIMTLGNHEFDLGSSPEGHKALADFIRGAKYPFVSSNIDFSKDTNLKGLFTDLISSDPKNGKIYNGIIKEVDGEKIGFFGLTTAETADISSPGKVEFKDYILEAKKAVKAFEGQGINKIVAVTHIGYDDNPAFDNDLLLAKNVPGIDVIVGGHSHTELKQPVVIDKDAKEVAKDPTVIVQAYQYGDFLGTLDVQFDSKGKIVGQAGELIKVADKQADSEAAQQLEKYSTKINELKNTEIGAKALKALENPRTKVDEKTEQSVRKNETSLGNIITDGMLAKAKQYNKNVIMALQNGGGIRAAIDEGPITVGEVITVLPFGNTLATMEVTGAELKSAFEVSFVKYPYENGGFLHVSGAKVTFDSSKPAGSRLVSIAYKAADNTYVDIKDNEKYTVAINAFTAKGGDGYDIFKKAYAEGRVTDLGLSDWENLAEHLKALKEVDPKVEGRIVDIAQ